MDDLKLLAGVAPSQLGNSAEFQPLVQAQEFRLLDVVLDPAEALVWSIMYLPPLVAEGFVGATSSNQVQGRLSLGQGGVATTDILFDWGTGGVLSVPASNVQLDIIWPDPEGDVFPQFQAPPSGEFRAWIVPGSMGGRAGPNTLTRRLGPITPFPVFRDVIIPTLARRWSCFGDGLVSVSGGGGQNGLFVDTVDAFATPLSRRFFFWNTNAFKSEAPNEEVLPGGAAVHRVSRQVGGFPPTNVSLVYTLGV